MKYIWELKFSDNILDRQEYVRRIKFEFIPKIQEKIKELEEMSYSEKPENIEQADWDIYLKSKKEETDYLLNHEKNFLKKLKISLSDYDIYKQRICCGICNEVVCVCEEVGLEKELSKLF